MFLRLTFTALGFKFEKMIVFIGSTVGLNVTFTAFPSSLSTSYPFAGPLLAREVMCSFSLLPGGYLMICLSSYPSVVW